MLKRLKYNIKRPIYIGSSLTVEEFKTKIDKIVSEVKSSTQAPILVRLEYNNDRDEYVLNLNSFRMETDDEYDLRVEKYRQTELKKKERLEKRLRTIQEKKLKEIEELKLKLAKLEGSIKSKGGKDAIKETSEDSEDLF